MMRLSLSRPTITMRFPLLYLLAAPFLRQLATGLPTNNDRIITLGYIAPLTGQFGFQQTGSASTMALQRAKEEGYLNGTDVRIVFRNGACNGKIASGAVYQLVTTLNVDGFLGLPCSTSALSAGLLLGHYNLPYLSYASIDPQLADKTNYNSLIRMMSPFNHMARALGVFADHLSWSRIVTVTAPDADGYCMYATSAILSAVNEFNITVPLQIQVQAGVSTVRPYDYDSIKVNGRIIFLCGPDDFIRGFMLGAYRKSMTFGDYVFISLGLVPTSTFQRPWVRNDGNDSIASQAYWSLFQMYVWTDTSDAGKQFRKSIPTALAASPWNYNFSLINNITASVFASFMYDVMYMYARVVDFMINNDMDYRDGNTVMKLARTIKFTGMSGHVVLDKNSDRISDYCIYHMPYVGASYELLANVLVTESNPKVQFVTQRNWGPSGMSVPGDSPACGFHDEYCLFNTAGSTAGIIVGVITAIVISIIGTVYFISYRTRRMNAERQLMTWKVGYDEIDFIGALKISQGSIMLKSESTNTHSSDSTISEIIASDNPHATIKLAHYKAAIVTVKSSRPTPILPHDEAELIAMRSFNQENVNEFLGLCTDPNYFYILMAFCPRGSLQDVLHNDDVKLDTYFKNSFISDILSGLTFLHRSTIKSHGRLKTANCLVSSRWTIKLTDYGLHNVRWGTLYESENEQYSALLWTSPEILRCPFPPSNGTKEGDVYGVGILMYNIEFRLAPFQTDSDTAVHVPKDIIGRIRYGEMPPLRPTIPSYADTSDEIADRRLVQLMQHCWSEDPNGRPTLTAVVAKFNEINNGKHYNLMDNMLKMMEDYTTNLETTVEVRSQALMEEKARIDLLLYNMLPAHMADALKAGIRLKPELFLDSSVYFSDICGFANMLSELKPIEIVNLLGKLWEEFDNTIAKHKVYKIRPSKSFQAAMLEEFAIPPDSADIDSLPVRIGINSGPVVGAVVGSTMPRYCLFGDTVNMASRIETNGQPYRIHISERTYYSLMTSDSGFICNKRGEINIKGKGIHTTYWLEGKRQ